MVGIAKLVIAPGCGPGGRGFESHYSPQFKQDRTNAYPALFFRFSLILQAFPTLLIFAPFGELLQDLAQNRQHATLHATVNATVTSAYKTRP